MNHNGFSFFPAIIPAGTVMYHGNPTQDRPETFEWLAFEQEHGEAFSLDARGPPPGKKAPEDDKTTHMKRRVKDQKLLSPINHGQIKTEAEGSIPGYIQSYQATKDLHALYLDGMAGGKTSLGTMDLELYVLYGKENKNFEDDEWVRAEAVCKLITPWGYDGYVRMEIGFEYIHCDFGKDLEQVSNLPVYSLYGLIGDSRLILSQWARAVAEDYNGVGSDRLRIDYSSMVSGLFYPLNITTMDPKRPDLMRLATAGMDELQKLKPELERMTRQPRRFTINWQAVTDTIIRRYANRLALMASDSVSQSHLITEFESTSRSHIRAPEPKTSKGPLTPELLEEAMLRCIKQPLLPAAIKKSQWSREDEFIAAALEVVTKDICTVILHSYNDLRAAKEKDLLEGGDSSDYHLSKAAKKAHRNVKDLVTTLNWSQWKQVRQCPVDEVMFTIMWPVGNDEDYFNPGCVPMSKIDMSREGYFRDAFPGGRRPVHNDSMQL